MAKDRRWAACLRCAALVFDGGCLKRCLVAGFDCHTWTAGMVMLMAALVMPNGRRPMHRLMHRYLLIVACIITQGLTEDLVVVWSHLNGSLTAVRGRLQVR